MTLCPHQTAIMFGATHPPEKDPNCQCIACRGYPREEKPVKAPEHFGLVCPNCGERLHGKIEVATLTAGR